MSKVLMTVNELERYAKIVRDDYNAEISDTVLALIDDWRTMKRELEACLLHYQSDDNSVRRRLDNLKVKP